MRRPAVLLAAGLALLLVAGIGWWATRPPTRSPADEGAATADRLSQPVPSPTPAMSGAPATKVPIQSGALPSAAEPVLPTRLRIPSIDVDARVVPVTVEDGTGEMQVPKAIDVVGWYRYGPALAEPAGSTVIAGHVDDADQGSGAFFRLRDVRVGERFTVTGSDGRTRGYRVVARQVYSKKKVPLDRLFARDGAPRLTLITCGGSFDAANRSYRDNIVVTATAT